MVEFSEDLRQRFEGASAVSQRAYYRLVNRKREIPYFNGGLDYSDFEYGSGISSAIHDVLSDFRLDVNISEEEGRITIGDIMVAIPEGLF